MSWQERRLAHPLGVGLEAMWLILGSPVRPLRLIGGSLATAALTATSFLLTVGWIYRMSDREFDAASRALLTTLLATCAICVLAVYVGALLADVPPVPAALSWILGFAIPWAVNEATKDPTGLYRIGLIFIVGIMAVGATIIALAVAKIRVAAGRRRL
jgi:hypothetical protein